MEIKKVELKWKGTLSKRKSTTKIIIHCSANTEGSKLTIQDVHNSHLKKGWAGCGYHYYIDTAGNIWQGRPEDTVGAHVTGQNSCSIGICYCGGINKAGKYADTRNAAQKKAMTELVKYLHNKYPKATFHGHKEFDNKACPCFDVQEWIKTVDFDDQKSGQINGQTINKCMCSICKVENCKNKNI